jgi:hypothetical protein
VGLVKVHESTRRLRQDQLDVLQQPKPATEAKPVRDLQPAEPEPVA